MTLADDWQQARTDWSMILNAVQDGEMSSEKAQEAMEHLARRYWPAVYAFIRSTGRDVHEAADLTQGFICDVVIGRRLLGLASPDRGRFRSLLLTALRNYLKETNRHGRRRKRRPSHDTEPLTIDAAHLAAAESEMCAAAPPETAFGIQWGAMLVQDVLREVHEACVRDGLEQHWIVFERRVVRPILDGSVPTPYAVLIEQLQLQDAAQAANMMVTVKRRFARALFLQVCRTVDDPLQAEGELHSLLHDLEQEP